MWYVYISWDNELIELNSQWNDVLEAQEWVEHLKAIYKDSITGMFEIWISQKYYEEYN